MPGDAHQRVNRQLRRLFSNLFKPQCCACGLEMRPHETHIWTSLTPTSFRRPLLSDANTPTVTIYSTAICPYCVAAKNFLKSKGLGWNEVRIDTDPAARDAMLARTRRTSVPQIFIGETHVGGYDDMMALHRAGKLEPLLAGSPA